ncbi:hypothetical protein [Anaerorhabdus sp.]|uniref:hypothetical protein n=1 Tax=Anaerorhabdus sp. TaxID=1872524 RepID=UPI002B398258|nr:hypothetical protein [Erysipelotrichales bacterium]
MLTVEDVMCIVKVKRTKAYEIIRELNRELKQNGYCTVTGRVSKEYFFEKYRIREEMMTWK